MQPGWIVRITRGPLEGTYALVESGVRWRHVKVTIDDETTRWVPVGAVEIVGDGT